MPKDDLKRAAHLIQMVAKWKMVRVRMLYDAEVSTGQPPVLFLLRLRGPMSQRELARALGLTAATMTVTLRRMEKAGLITRTTDETDKRIQRVAITQAGLEVCSRSWQAMCAADLEMFEGFSPQEIGALCETMERMLENLVRSTGKPQPGDAFYEEYMRHVLHRDEKKG